MKKKHPLEDLAGFEVYKKNCRLCHGMDGQKGLGGAKDLSVSNLTIEERTLIISLGKGSMKAYQESLTGQEISDVADFIGHLRSTE